MKRVNIKYLVISATLILAISLSSGCVLPNIDISPPPSSPPTLTDSPIDPDWTSPFVESNALVLPSIADVVAEVKPSVVAINTEVITYDFFNQPFIQEGAGSGWIVDKNGIIITNNHVVAGAESITVTLADGRTFPVDRNAVFTDSLTDLAVLKIDAENLPSAKVGDSDKLRVGYWLVAIGNPLGLGISAKEGIVSRLGVSIAVSSGQTLYDLVETSAAINPGNSGGPLVNMQGEVIGITSIKIAITGVEGMGYAISINVAMPIIEELVTTGYVIRPYLGVGLHPTYDEGALVTRVAPGSPADKEAGLEAGDIIVRMNGEEISTAQELIQAVHSYQIGQLVEITYWRGETKYTTYATLIESPSPY